MAKVNKFVDESHKKYDKLCTQSKQMLDKLEVGFHIDNYFLHKIKSYMYMFCQATVTQVSRQEQCLIGGIQ